MNYEYMNMFVANVNKSKVSYKSQANKLLTLSVEYLRKNTKKQHKPMFYNDFKPNKT